MKKITALAIALFLALSLAACDDSGNGTGEPTAALQGDMGPSQTTDEEPSVTSGVTLEDNDATFAEDDNSIAVDITATNVYVLNADANSVLYQKNSDELIAPASTAKILTALTVIEHCSLDDAVTVGSEIELIASDSSRAWLNQGDTLTVRQLLVALLLPSGNDAAYTLAVNAGRKIAGNDALSTQKAISVFVDAMNRKAKAAGVISSVFMNPDGYDADGQVTTAFDLAQIAKACIESEALMEIMGKYKSSDTWLGGREVTYHSTNELINPDSQYYYPNAVGLKTGSTEDAGACLVSAAEIDGQIYICVVMGSSAGVRFTDSLAVFSAIDPRLSPPGEYDGASLAPPGEPKQ